MKSILESYKKDINSILEGFDLLERYEFVPFKLYDREVTRETLSEQKENLSENAFIVSVCGQIKTGKSTFLNYLLFNGNNILPTDDLPETAKITKIYYGPENHVRIHYYSKKDWETLKNSTIKLNEKFVTYYEGILREELENRANAGVRETDKVRETSLVERLDDLDALKHYVAKEGKYTPFVNYVEIILNSEMVKEVILVDTPGLNDANIIRSKQTKDFIDHSSAVIYLLHAEEPLGRSDLDFIDKYLFTIPSDKILFAISKCDNIRGDETKVVNYVEETIKKQPEIKNRRLLDGRKVYAISTMAAIISHKLKNGNSLTEEETFYKGKIAENLINSEGSLPEIIDAISNNIMNDKGTAILKSFRQKVRGYCDGKIDELEYRRNILLGEIDLLSLSKKEMEEKNEAIKKLFDDIEDFKRSNRTKYDIIRKTFKNKINNELDIINDAVKGDFEKWVHSHKTFQPVRDYSQYELKQLIDKKLRAFFTEGFGKQIGEDIRDFIIDSKNELRDISADVIGANWKFFDPVIDFQDITQLIESEFADVNSSSLEEFRNYFLFITDSQRSNNDVINHVKTLLNNFFKERLLDKLVLSIYNEKDIYMEDIISKARSIATEKRQFLNQLQQEDEKADRSRIELEKEITSLDAQINVKKEKKLEIMELIGV